MVIVLVLDRVILVGTVFVIDMSFLAFFWAFISFRSMFPLPLPIPVPLPHWLLESLPENDGAMICCYVDCLVEVRQSLSFFELICSFCTRFGVRARRNFCDFMIISILTIWMILEWNCIIVFMFYSVYYLYYIVKLIT